MNTGPMRCCCYCCCCQLFFNDSTSETIGKKKKEYFVFSVSPLCYYDAERTMCVCAHALCTVLLTMEINVFCWFFFFCSFFGSSSTCKNVLDTHTKPDNTIWFDLWLVARNFGSQFHSRRWLAVSTVLIKFTNWLHSCLHCE